MKRTYQPSVIIRKRRHGFLRRMSDSISKKVILNRRRKGRKKLTV